LGRICFDKKRIKGGKKGTMGRLDCFTYLHFYLRIRLSKLKYL
jgi:hypothetical protein